jgi:endoglucanase
MPFLLRYCFKDISKILNLEEFIMKKKIFRSMAAGLVSVAMIIPSAANAVSTSVSASQLLGETSFENKTLPWQSVQTGNAEQNIQIQNGALLVDIFSANGADKEKWDLQIRHRDLDFKAGHTYEISFRAKA